MIRPTTFEVDNGTGITTDIRIDHSSLMEGDLFFEIDQDGNGVAVTLECLRGLVEAAEQLMAGRKP